MNTSSLASKSFVTLFLVATLLPLRTSAQTSGTPIEFQESYRRDRPLLNKARELRDAGQLWSAEKINRALEDPSPSPIDLARRRTRSLRPKEIATRSRETYLRAGWYYLCPKCEHWHLNLSGAYAISKDTLVTCYHVLKPNIEMREAFFLVADSTTNVLSITSVLAAHKEMDVAILRVRERKLTPLPLNDNISVGDPVYCFSDPYDQSGYFTSGIVNRFFWRSAKKGTPGSLRELSYLRMNVSTDWAHGSSGAAVLDECGNAIGHVSSLYSFPVPEAVPAPIQTPDPDDSEAPSPSKAPVPQKALGHEIILHEAIPARAVLALARSLATSTDTKPNRTKNPSELSHQP